jgi:DNA-binding response OmpR family regulator
VYLPATNGQPATVSQPQPVAVAPALRILVIDDEVALARSLARILDRHQVEIVNSGRDALDVLAKQTFDVVICDVMMPDITGIQLYETLRAREHPIIDRFLFVTGGVSTVESQRFLDELGPKRWLAKPIPMAEVRARVDRIGRTTRDDTASRG